MDDFHITIPIEANIIQNEYYTQSNNNETNLNQLYFAYQLWFAIICIHTICIN